jgi:hypothetical protein
VLWGRKPELRRGMLPPGILNALKGHHDSIVTVACLGACLTAIECGVPAWAAIAALALSLVVSHLRATTKERHIEALARRQMIEAMVRLATVEINGSASVLPPRRKPRNGEDGKGQ